MNNRMMIPLFVVVAVLSFGVSTAFAAADKPVSPLLSQTMMPPPPDRDNNMPPPPPPDRDNNHPRPR